MICPWLHAKVTRRGITCRSYHCLNPMLASSNPVEAQPIATQGKGNEILRNARPRLDLPLAQEALDRCATQEDPTTMRSEEHTSELQSLMRISYAVFCLKKKIQKRIIN